MQDCEMKKSDANLRDYSMIGLLEIEAEVMVVVMTVVQVFELGMTKVCCS